MIVGDPTRARWVLVTGTPRAGTTFTGLMLSAPREVDYLHEPFNPDCGLPGIDQEYLYTRPGLRNEPEVRRIVSAMRTYRTSLRTGIFRRDSLRKRLIKRVIGSRGPFYFRFAKLNPFRQAVVVKDPKACLLTEYLVREHGFAAVVLVRHPAAFVASQMRLGPNMKTELAALAAQPDLLADHFGGDARAVTPTSDEPLEIACLLWASLTRVMLAQSRGLPSTTIMRHEDISQRPLESFRTLCDATGLPWNERMATRIRRMTAGGSAEARDNQTQDFRRDSSRIFSHRLQSLDPAQRRRIWELTHEVAAGYYPEETFGL